MTLKYGNKSVPFGAIVTHGENKNGSIVSENGQVYLTGLPQSGNVDEITRNAQFPLKARAITVNGNASQGTIEALINVIYTWQ
nr:FimD/PapC C-terminal domain-containing protein [Escherichia coli]